MNFIKPSSAPSPSLRFLCVAAAAAATVVALPLAAQTHTSIATHHTATHTRRRPVHAAEPACATLPELSPKIPALPTGTSCAKPLYTLTREPELKLDYASPMISPEVRKVLDPGPTTFSLDYIDILTGSGELARPGKYLSVKYTGYLSTGAKFDSSEDHPGKEPINFQYGEHHVIEGWDTGFEGMHVGGKRRLFIPWELAYGERGRPPVIPAKAMLVFDMELVGVSDTPPEPKQPAPVPHPAPRPTAPPQPAQPQPAQPQPARPEPQAAKPTTPAPSHPQR